MSAPQWELLQNAILRVNGFSQSTLGRFEIAHYGGQIELAIVYESNVKLSFIYRNISQWLMQWHGLALHESQV